MRVGRIFCVALFVIWASLQSFLPCLAAPPVRIAVVPASGSGKEQSMVDGLTNNLQGNANVVVSTVNPDWYVVCTIVEHLDQAAGSVLVNGTVLIKSAADGQVIATVSGQSNKSDFSLQPGSPINKALVTQAVNEVVDSMIQRAQQPLAEAVEIEIQTRDRIIQAEQLADKDQYEEAITLLLPINPSTPHFKAVRGLISEFEMEKQVLALVKEAESLANRGKYVQAIRLLKEVPPKSKRFRLAKMRISIYTSAMQRGVRPTARRAVPPAKSQSAGPMDAQLQALQAKKRALEAERRAIEAEEAALKSKVK